MSKAILCDYGLICHGETDDELLSAAERHLREDHPGLAGRVRASDLLRQQLAAIGADRDIRAVVITGAGSAL